MGSCSDWLQEIFEAAIPFVLTMEYVQMNTILALYWAWNLSRKLF